VAQLYPQGLSTHFSRLSVGYSGTILFPGHHTGKTVILTYQKQGLYVFLSLRALFKIHFLPYTLRRVAAKKKTQPVDGI